VFSLAGADWPEDYEFLRSHLSTEFSFRFSPVVVNDSIGGLRSGAPDWEGIAIICGTGNAVGARRRDGVYFHLGFWPDTIGALALSRAALDAVSRDHLGLGPATSLTARAIELFDTDDPMTLLHELTRRGGLGRSDVVRMSPVLLDEADRGDRVALDLVSTAGRALGGQGRVSAEHIDLEVVESRVVMGGGLFRHPTMVLEEAVMSELPGARPTRTTGPPVIGALLAAMDTIGSDCDPDALRRSLEEWDHCPS
jgi:N-acetylglucosamine kinase-like BadF-type ATPase